MKHRKQYPFIICIKCLHVPLISIYNERVIIKCKCERTITSFDIKAYIHLLSFFDREIQKHFIPCETVLSHYNNKAKAYCLNCKGYLCSICIKQHKNYSSHYILPFQIHDISQRKSNDNLLFCFDCFNAININDKGNFHNAHYVIRMNEIKNINVKEHYSSFLKIKHCYKKIMKETHMRAVKKWNHYEKEYNNEYNKCIQLNEQKVFLIASFFYSYLILPNYNFQLLANICNNTIFTINTTNYKKLPKFNCSYDYTIFLRKFSIIDHNKTFDWFDESYYIYLKKRYICKNIKVKVMRTLSDNKQIALGDDKGKIFIYDIHTTKLNIYYNIHSKAIVDFLILPNGLLVSYSLDMTIKIWDVKEMECILEKVYFFKAHSAEIVKVVYLKETFLASIDSNGVLYIWDYCNTNYIKEEKSLLNFPIKKDINLFYFSKQNLLLKFANAHIYFVYIEPLRIDSTIVKGIFIKGNRTVCQLGENKVVFGGYRQKDKVPFIYVLNVRTKQIETMIEYDCIPKKFDPYKKMFHLFFKFKDLIIYTQDGSFISLNQDTLTINKRYIMKKELENIISIQKQSNSCYAIGENREIFVITIW